MKTSAKCTILKNAAKNIMAGKYYFAIMALLFFSMITLFFVRFSMNLTNQVCQTLINFSASGLAIEIMSFIVPFLLSIVLNVLQLGVCFYFMKLTTNHSFAAFDLTYGYFHNFRKSICISGVMTLLSFICFLPTDIFLTIIDAGYRLDGSEQLTTLLIQSVLLIFYVPTSLALSQSYYLMLDYPELPVVEILKRSRHLMHGKKRQLFYVRLSFLPLFVICILTFGIGLFWMIPYYQVTMALYYLDLMKPSDPN